MTFIDCLQSFDISVLDRLQSAFRGSFADGFWKFISFFGDGGIFLLVLAAILLLFKKTRKGGLAMLIAITIGFIVGNLIIKNAVARERPYDVISLMAPHLAVEKLADKSFPSGHTMASLGGALALFYVNRKQGLPLVVLSILIMISRLHLYVHYPSDIIGGAVIALCTSFIGFIAAEHIMARIEPWLDGKLATLKAKLSRKTAKRRGAGTSSPGSDVNGGDAN